MLNNKAFRLIKKRPAFYGLLFGFVLVIAGLTVVLPNIYFSYQASAGTEIPISINSEPLPIAPEIKSGQPIRLVVPSVGIDIAVSDGLYNEKTKSWNVSKTDAHFATITNLPNNFKGNTFIYGHNRPSVFYKLPKISLGAQAIVYTDNNLVFTYTLSAVSETNPQDASALLDLKETPVLTLQTCSGAWFQNRQIFTFDYTDVKSAE